MADLEERIDKLEEKVRQLEIDINKSLADIKTSLVEIKAVLEEKTSNGDFKNEIIKKDIKANADKIKEVEDRVKQQEDSKRWLVRLIFGTIIGLLFEAIAFYQKMKGVL